MKAQFDNKVMSSLYLWFDHTLLKEGEAFTNYGSLFYPVNNLYQGYYTYGSPFRQFVADSSISGDAARPNFGANIINEIYLDNVPKNRTESNFTGINYGQGQVYFTDEVDTNVKISGNYAIKDFNIFLTNETEERLLFETQFTLSNKISNTPAGLPPDSLTYPAIFIKNMGGFNEPFQFGGTDETIINSRAIVIADSQFGLDAVCSIFRDTTKEYIGILEENEMPFNNLGDFNNYTDYNYTGITQSKIGTDNSIFIDSVNISKIGGASFAGLNNVNPNIYSALIDFELKKIRNT
tara:strand:- start:831 stop:1712 length:882 start_codon:yes stop_codon:yes gene_type:complete